jgi:hypothetical protein
VAKATLSPLGSDAASPGSDKPAKAKDATNDASDGADSGSGSSSGSGSGSGAKNDGGDGDDRTSPNPPDGPDAGPDGLPWPDDWATIVTMSGSAGTARSRTFRLDPGRLGLLWDIDLTSEDGWCSIRLYPAGADPSTSGEFVELARPGVGLPDSGFLVLKETRDGERLFVYVTASSCRWAITLAHGK